MTSHQSPPPPSFIAAVLQQHRKFILDIARWMGVPTFDLDDVYQRVGLALAGAPQNIPREGDLRPWLRAVTRRKVRSYFAQYPQRMLILPLSAIERLAPPSTFEGRIILRQSRNIVRAAIRRLPRRRRLIWLLHEYRRLTFKEIAARLQLPLSTVADHHRTALRALTVRLRRRAGAEERRPGGRSFAIVPFFLWRRDITVRSRACFARSLQTQDPPRLAPASPPSAASLAKPPLSRSVEPPEPPRSPLPPPRSPVSRRAIPLSIAAACLLCALIPWHTLPRRALGSVALGGAVTGEIAAPAGARSAAFVHGAAPARAEPLLPVAVMPAPTETPLPSTASLAGPPPRAPASPPPAASLAKPPLSRSVELPEPDPYRDILPARAWLERAQRAASAGDVQLAREALRGYDAYAPDNPLPEARRAVVRTVEGSRR